MKLHEKFSEIEFFNIEEVMEKLDWSFVKSGNSYEKLRCCDEPINTGGFFGTEYAYCSKCDRSIQHIQGVIRTGNSTAGMIDFSDVEDIDTEPRQWFISSYGSEAGRVHIKAVRH